MMDMTFVKHKRNNPTCDPWDSQGIDKMQFLFLLISALTFRFEMNLHVGRVTHTFKVGRAVRNLPFIYKSLTGTLFP